MPAFVIANVQVENAEPYAGYSRQVEATLQPFGGRFIVRGTDKDVLEGDWHDRIVVIEFPDRDSARRWYTSDAYQKILPIRLQNSISRTLIAPGYPPE
jgi:uncharacterized protein (DUF1330 family)